MKGAIHGLSAREMYEYAASVFAVRMRSRPHGSCKACLREVGIGWENQLVTGER
jgi:hypothetical protein